MCWITSLFRCCRHGKNSVNTLMTRVIKCDFIVLSSSSFRRYSLFSNELMSGTRGLVLSNDRIVLSNACPNFDDFEGLCWREFCNQNCQIPYVFSLISWARVPPMSSMRFL